MSNTKKKTTSTKKATATKKVETAKVEAKKSAVKTTKKKESFFSKYGSIVIIGALLVVFGAVLIGLNADKSGEASGGKGSLISMSVSEWQSKIKEDKVISTTLAQTTCSWCNKFKPVLTKVVEENSIDVVWLDVDTLSAEDYEKLTGTFEELKEFGTPHTIITKSGKIIGTISGYVEESSLISSFKQYGVIK